ncbi:MAG TPA: YciI family protein [Actinomycetota bacterium]|nr:YciI family protein [Actinomycetota bacterium]
MRYLLLIYGDEKATAATPPEELEVSRKAWMDYDGWLREQGWRRAGDALQETSTATTVREKGGTIVTTDGPFAETKEQLGGYYLIECEDLDDAIQAASRMPTMGRGSVEIRPVRDVGMRNEPS